MVCPSCSKEVAPDGFFCVWCERYLLAPERGVKAGLFRRWVAMAIDPLIGITLYFGALAIVASISREAASIAAVVLLLAYFVWYFDMLRKEPPLARLCSGCTSCGRGRRASLASR